MKPHVTVPFTAFVVLGLVVCALPAHAQDPQDAQLNAPCVEVTPFVSFGSASSSQVGAALAFRWTSKFSLEAEMGYRRQEINALSSHVSLLYDLPKVGRVTPYLAGGVGLEQYGTALEVPGGIVSQARTAFTINAGGGLKVPVDDKWGLRTDARWFNGLGRHAPEHWRIYNGITWGRKRR